MMKKTTTTNAFQWRFAASLARAKNISINDDQWIIADIVLDVWKIESPYYSPVEKSQSTRKNARKNSFLFQQISTLGS